MVSTITSYFLKRNEKTTTLIQLCTSPVILRKFDLEIDQDLEFAAHFLPRSPTEPLAVNTAKEDEVTSSEEAGPIEARVEPKGKNLRVNRWIKQRALLLSEELTSTRLAPAIANSGSADYNVSSFSILPTENIYEFAAKLLFFAVRWARSIHSFLQVRISCISNAFGKATIKNVCSSRSSCPTETRLSYWRSPGASCSC